MNRIKSLHLTHSINKHKILLVIGYFLFFCKLSTAQEATISEKIINIPTYAFGDPNPVATLALGEEHIYPYFQFDGYSQRAKSKKWNVITMENKYLRVLILPEVGGKIWGAVEKSTGQEFIYKNEVLKFRNIALRGPWTSGGIEFNFGITGHTPATATPVDYKIQENPDGSVSCIIGTLDLHSRTKWLVKITLPADKAFFETVSYWFNPTPLHQSNYVWQNAAIATGDDLQFFFPGRYYVGHPGDVHPWPVRSDGKDLSYYRNNDFGGSKSYHVFGTVGPSSEHFGAYWHDKKIGTGNWSLNTDAPGKKLWIWAQSRSGAIWEDLLTDTDGQYVEIQSGRFYSQASSTSLSTPFDYNALSPYSGNYWSEIWFPVINTGGISSASRHGVIHVSEEKNRKIISLMALQAIEDSLTVYSNGKVISTNPINLSPLQVYRDTLQQSVSNSLHIILGNEKLVYKSSKSQNYYRPTTTQIETDSTSASFWYNKGKNEMFNRQYNDAQTSFTSSLLLDSAFIPSYQKLAELAYRKTDFENSLKFAQKALSFNTYDAEANFMLGQTLKQKGLHSQALEAYGWAARSGEYASAAYYAMSQIYLLENNLTRAEEFALRAINSSPYNIEAIKLLAVVYRKKNKTQKAKSVLESILKRDELNHFARFEYYLHNPSDPQLLGAFNKMIRSEFPAETYLELALTYKRWGQKQDAIMVLKQSDKHPIVGYWIAYMIKNDNKIESRQYIEQANQLSPYLIFPFRSESISMLKWVSEQTDSWKPDYYRALIYWYKGKQEEAISLLNALKTLPDYAPFYLIRAHLNKKIDNNKEFVEEDLQRAKKLNKTEWRSWHALNQFYFNNNITKIFLTHSYQAFHTFPDKDAIKLDYARALLHNGKYEECIEHLEKITILPFEGAQMGRTLYEQALLFAAINSIQNNQLKKAEHYIENSRKWPENLGVGKPYNPDLRFQDYLDALIHQKRKNSRQTSILFDRIIKYSDEFPSRKGMGYAITALTYREMGKPIKARKMIEEWYKARPNDSLRYLVYTFFKGDIITAEKIIGKNPHDLQLLLIKQIIVDVK